MDTILTVILGILQFLLVGVGIYVTLKPQPSNRHKSLFIGFIICGLLGIAVGVYQQYQNGEQQKTQQEEFNSKLKEIGGNLLQSQLSQEFVKGQLNAMTLVVGQIAKAVSDPGIKQMATAMEKMAQSSSPTIMVANKQICSNTMDLVKRMQKFQYDWNQALDKLYGNPMARRDQGGQHNQEFDLQFRQLASRREHEFKNNLLGEAVYLRNELLKRLPPQPEVKPWEAMVFEGRLSGPSPVGDAAIYLETLSRKLCPQ